MSFSLYLSCVLLKSQKPRLFVLLSSLSSRHLFEGDFCVKENLSLVSILSLRNSSATIAFMTFTEVISLLYKLELKGGNLHPRDFGAP